MTNTTTLSEITAKYGHGRTGQIECMTAAYIGAVRDWHSSQLMMFKEDYERAAYVLITKYGVQPSTLQEIYDRITA
jgi:hypothetical protein|tara:strand:+ start:1139 stop:1366 length:228 start_codon:yes stop_codon:yes gene_type:complete